GAPGHAQEREPVRVLRGLPQCVAEHQEDEDHRHADGEDDGRSELRPDRGKPLERTRAHGCSWNAYPTPWMVRMNRGSFPSSPSLRRMRATCESTTRPPA